MLKSMKIHLASAAALLLICCSGGSGKDAAADEVEDTSADAGADGQADDAGDLEEEEENELSCVPPTDPAPGEPVTRRPSFTRGRPERNRRCELFSRGLAFRSLPAGLALLI